MVINASWSNSIDFALALNFNARISIPNAWAVTNLIEARRNTYMQRLAIIPHISASRTLVIPVQLAMIEVLGLGFARHTMRYRAKYTLHHCQVFAIIVRLE